MFTALGRQDFRPFPMPWWDSYIKPVQKEENKFATVGYQRQLAAELHRVEPNSEVGHEQMAETLRTVAEMMVWGDKNDRTVLDYFLEQNIVGHFVSLLAQRPNKHVTCQVVNHLSMLLQSLNSPEAVFFLLSNNHINLLINHNFDFTDEEVASYYVSFLKSISLRLNVSTVQLFFNASTKEFPLFVEATKFFDHPESMVRIAVRTLTLNIFRVDDVELRRYLVETASPYFINVAVHLRQRYVHLSQLCASASSYSTQTLGHIDTEFSEQLDWLFYFQDICRLGIQPLTLELIRALCNEWLLASVLRSLEQATLTTPGEAADHTLRTTIALSALTQLFHIFDATTLPRVLYAALFCAQPQADHCVRALMNESALAEGSGLKEWEEVIEAVTSTPDEMFEQIGSGPLLYGALASADDDVVLAALCTLHTIGRSSLDPSALLAVGIAAIAKSSARAESPQGAATTAAAHQLMAKARPHSSADSGSAATVLHAHVDSQEATTVAAVASAAPIGLLLSAAGTARRVQALGSRLVQIVTRTRCTRLITLRLAAELLGLLVETAVAASVCSMAAFEAYAAAVRHAHNLHAQHVRSYMEAASSSGADVFDDALSDAAHAPSLLERWDAFISDSSLLIPPISLSSQSCVTELKFPLQKRMAADETEAMRVSVQAIVALRCLLSKLGCVSFTDSIAPSLSDRARAQEGDVVDTRDTDIMTCSVAVLSGGAFSMELRYLISTHSAIVLTEPDQRKLYSAIARLVIPFRSISGVQVDTHDACGLIISLNGYSGRTAPVHIYFPDAAHCHSAAQRLTDHQAELHTGRLERISKALQDIEEC